MRVKDSIFLVYGLEFLLSYVGAEATQKGRFYSEFTYFPSNFLYLFPPTRTGLVGPGSRRHLHPPPSRRVRREATGGQGVELQMASAV